VSEIVEPLVPDEDVLIELDRGGSHIETFTCKLKLFFVSQRMCDDLFIVEKALGDLPSVISDVLPHRMDFL